MVTNPVTSALADPHMLEELYRQDPDLFTGHFRQAFQIHPQAQILKFWQARLEFSKTTNANSRRITGTQLMGLVLLCLTATVLIKLPDFFTIDNIWFYSRFSPAVVVSMLIIYFVASSYFPNQGTSAGTELYPLSVKYAVVGTVLVTLLILLFLPDEKLSASIIMSVIHAPLVLWLVLGLVFTAKDWRIPNNRLDYLKYNGELVIYTTLILLGGVVLSVLTLGLFSLLDLGIAGWYQRNVIIAGLVSAPLVATFLFDKVMFRKSRLATTIANVFTPLFLIMVVAYLVAMAIEQKSPFSDRNFLILINGLLLIVLAMSVFSICGRNHQSPSRLADTINLGLIAVTLIINLFALSAILYRFSEWGISPNRVVVTGANILIFTHLCQILRAYINTIKSELQSTNESSALGEGLIRSTVGFLPIYGAWAVIVMVVLPVVFQFK